MKIGLYTRNLSSSFRAEFEQLSSALHRHQVDTEEIEGQIPDGHYDFIFSIGGDGTLLSAVHLIADRAIPVVGINFGHLGFLTTVGREDWNGDASTGNHFDLLVEDLLAGHYTVEPRTLLHVDIGTPTPQPPLAALNEVSLHRVDDTNLLRTDLYVDNDFVASYDGDGLLVATPTGSTAYSLSCGGPILTPDCGCFVVTPIAVHNLSLRPIIVPDSAVLRLVTAPGGAVNLGTDSRHLMLDGGCEITLSRENYTVRLVRLRDQSFFSAIHQKLSWGGSGRTR